MLKPQAVSESKEPIDSGHGTQIPPLSEQGKLPSAPKEIDQALPDWQKKQTEWNKSLEAGYQAEQRLNTIRGAFQAIQTGAFTTDRADWAAKLRAIGANNLADRIMAHPEQAQLALHENIIETLDQLKATNPRFAQMEFKTLQGNKEHPNLLPEANLQMLSEDIGQLRQSRELVRDWSIAQQHDWRNPLAYESAWLEHNKLSDYVKRTREEIGPLKGMKGSEQRSALPQGWTYLGTGK